MTDFNTKKIILYLSGVLIFIVLIALVLLVDGPDITKEKKAYIPKKSIVVSSELVSPTEIPTEDILTSLETSKLNTTILNIIEPSSKIQSYILPNSDKKELTIAELKKLNISELNLAKNEIFARHGYIFKKAEYREYFLKKPWYKENPNYSDKDLNAIEKKNITIIVNYIKESGN